VAAISLSIQALCLVLLAAALEGLAAGSGVKAKLARLRRPKPSPPFAAWLAIGGFYYLTCFAVAVRLLGLARSPGRDLALCLLALLLLSNAAWNLAFFRQGNLRLSWLVSAGYAVLAPALAATLFRVDAGSFWPFLPYLIYLGYGTWWVWKTYKLNTASGVA
jgi:tryptophan-rich sensory protein